MSITIDVICYTSKALKNNEYPLMLRLTKVENPVLIAPFCQSKLTLFSKIRLTPYAKIKMSPAGM